MSNTFNAEEESKFLEAITCPVCSCVDCECTEEQLAAARNLMIQNNPSVDASLEAAKEEEQEDTPTVYDLLFQLKNAPTMEQIEKWKKQYGQIYSMVFMVDDIYLFKSLNKEEWDSINNSPASQGPNREAFITFQTVNKCLLWPRLSAVEFQSKQGGLLPSLCEMIMMHSYFLSQSHALTMVQRL